MLIAGALYFKFAANPYVHGGLRGCAAGALGLTIGNALELSVGRTLRLVTHSARCVVTAVTVSFLKMPLLLVLVTFGGIGIVHEYLRHVRQRSHRRDR